ncbi:MAG: saccharopine dehydrogenase family protein [Bacillota bacterium]
MKIVVLGGAGEMGAETVRDLARYSKATDIVIADKNVHAAEKLIESLDTHRVRVREIDATSHNDLVRVMHGSSAVAGALGPFYRFEKPVIEAAIEARANYVSICDDLDAVEAALAFDNIARQEGRRILTGMGWTPGLSNLLARKGYEELDEVEAINIYWSTGAADLAGLAVILHTMHIFTGEATSFQGGHFIKVKAGSKKEPVEFPPPMGMANTFHLGHPEPVTIPRYLGRINEVTLKGGLAEGYLNYLSRFVSALGLTRVQFTQQLTGQIVKAVMPVMPKSKKRNVSTLRVDIKGKRNGINVTVSYAVTDHMRRLTGLPLSIGTMMMAANKIKRFGVFSPEADNAIDIKEFLKELKIRDIEVGQREI